MNNMLPEIIQYMKANSCNDIIIADSAKLTPYKEIEHYTLTKRFLDNPENMLRYLLEN